MKRPVKRKPRAPRKPARSRPEAGTAPRTPDDAIRDLARSMKHQAHLHRDLDAQRAWTASPQFHLERARVQLRELRLLLPSLDEAHVDPIRARRIRQTCANCANYLAFLHAHTRRRRR